MTKRGLTIFALFIILISQGLFSQVNSDSIFNVAIKEASNKNYVKALENAEKVLAIHSNRIDVLLFIANVYSWQNNYDTAKIYIKKAQALDNTSQELYDSWLNILLWNNEPEALLETCNIAESDGYKNKYNLFLKRLLANKTLENYKQIIDLIEDENNKVYLDSSQINYLYKEVLLLDKNQTLAAYYSLDLFDNNLPQHLAYVDYSFKIRKHRLIFRANFTHKFEKNGLQLESDFYKVMKKNRYMYFNYGYAIDNIIFPQHRAGYEFYFPIKFNFETSIGARYLLFPDISVFIATGHLSKYVGKNWFAFRPFYAFQEIGNSFSFVSTFRRYASNKLNYWGLELGYGNSPDDRFVITQNDEFFRLNSYKIKLNRNFMIGKTNDLKIGVAYAYDEFRSGSYRNRYIIEFIYKIRV